MLAPLPTVISGALEVPLATGGVTTYVNLDNAASTSSLTPVAEAVATALPWYSSVHRGAGFPSQVSTRLYEAARAQVANFVGARPTDSVIFVRNTTDALNTLAHILPIPAGGVILTTAVEHHANLLPWRRAAPVVHLPVPETPQALLDSLTAALTDKQTAVTAVAVTGASNVTGEVFPLADIAEITHRHGAILIVDAAQLAPHRAIDMAALGIDCLAISGHKMYAPYGAGALVVPTELVAERQPFLAGGGAVDLVDLDSVIWTHMPDRHEAGSPNVIGAVALGAATAVLGEIGMDRVRAHEQALIDTLVEGVRDLPKLKRLTLWPGDAVDRVGVFTFVLEGMPYAMVAAALSAEWGIGVRHGCFCAHPYLTHLLGVPQAEVEYLRSQLTHGDRPSLPGAIRASFGLGTTGRDVDRLIEALHVLCKDGPQLEYRADETTGDYLPLNDPRPWPVLAGLPDIGGVDAGGAGCGSL